MPIDTRAVRRRACAAVIGVTLSACLADPPTVVRNPRAAGLTPVPNPYNSLSVLVSFQSVDADSGRVVYWASGDPPSATPFSALHNGIDTIAILGLKPQTTYYETVDLLGPGGTSRSDTVQIASGVLPADLQNVRLALTGSPGSGYTLTALYVDTSAYVIAFDDSGRIRWYRGFAEGLSPGETKQQPDGNFTVYVGQSIGFNASYGRYVEFRPSGDVVQDYFAGQPYYTDDHELTLVEGDGQRDGAYLFGYDIRFVDLSPYGGPTNAAVAGHVLLEHSPSEMPEFVWSAWDHFAVTDCVNPPPGKIANLDFDHPNSFAFDLDSSYVVSFYRFNAVVKIDARTGHVLWQLGGNKNQFTILNDPLAGFGAQHDAQILANGHLLMYDNGQYHTPPESRAVEYSLDLTSMTATMVWQYRHTLPIFTPVLGSAQRLKDGNTFVGFGEVGHVTEVAPDGTVIWEGNVEVNGSSASVYRAIRIESLYRYERP